MAGRGFWKSFRMFAPLSPSALDAVAATARQHTWHPGEVMFQRGDAGDYMIALATGRVKISLITQGGRELVLRQAEAGEMLGELSLFDAEPRSADCMAVGAVTGFVLTRRDFLDLAARYSELNQAALAHLCAMLRDTTERLESIALYQLQARLARFILFALQQLHGPDIPDGAALSLGLSQGELAALLGASRPKVNRILQHFRDEGILRSDGDAWVCDVAALRAEAVQDD